MKLSNLFNFLASPSIPSPTKGTPNEGRKDVDQQVANVEPHVREMAWTFPSLIYNLADFPRYNPDDLIGRKGYKIYKKMMLDEQVKAVIKFRRSAITSRDWYFELKDSPLSETEEGLRRIKIMTCAAQKINGSFSDGMNAIMSATYTGFSITEPIMQQFQLEGKTYWGLKRLKLKPYDTFFFTPDEYGEIVKFEQWVSGKRQELKIEDFIHFVVNPDVDEHYGESDLRAAYRAYFSKDMIIKFRNIWLERHAGGARWVQASKENGAALSPNTPDYSKVQDILTNFQTSTGAIMPRGLELMMQYPANQVAYKEAIDDYDMMIARSQLVPNLLGVSPQGEHGSLAQADTQLEAFFWTLDSDADRLEDALNEQLFSKIGALNFGDDDTPQLRLKPLSDKKKMDIISKWSELVSKKAVQATDSDEKYIRELLDFPEAGEPINQPEVIDANGNPVQRDANGNPVPNDPKGKSEAGSSTPSGKPSGTDKNKDKEGNGRGGDNQDETIIGRNKVRVDSRAKMRAVQRVDFAVIKRRAEDVILESAHTVARVMGEMVLDIFKTIESNNLVSEEKVPRINELKFDGTRKSKLRRVISNALKNGWEVGLKHGANEVDKAMEKHFSRDADRTRLTLIGAEFFDQKSFTIAGKLSDDAIATIKTILLNGVKNTKSVKEVKDEIIDRFAKDGMISREDVLDYFGEATDYSNPEARLETIIRTNTFEAINEGRYAYFTDPALKGFVEALEYSAIMDDRTTEICSSLDGHIHPADDEFWSVYTPPNHFNCRSLIVPVTQNDTWTESDRENLPDPQKGFG